MIQRTSHITFKFYCRYYATSPSSSSTAPPMLLKIRKDLKAAMQAKDSNRLAVLRSILAQTVNASKTSTPIKTDLQMLALLRKAANASRTASEEFKGAGRQDLADKEESQAKIMEEYAQSVKTVGDEDIMAAVKGVVDKMKDEGAVMQMGEVIKRVLTPEILGEKPVARGEIAKMVKKVLVEL